MRWSVNFACAAVMLVFGACHPPRVTPPVPPGEWTSTLGDATRSAYADQSIDGGLDIDWSKGVDRGFTAAVHVHGPVIVATTSGRSVVTLNANSGMQYWSRRFSGPIAGAALRRDDRIYVATGDRENKVHALDIHRGRGMWSRRVGPVRVEPVLLSNTLVVVTEDGEVVALDVSNGSPVWRTHVGAAPAVAPVAASGQIFVATANDTLYRIDTANGEVRARTSLGSTPSAPMLVMDGRVIVALHSGNVVAVSADPLAIRWSANVSAVVVAAPVAIGDDIFVLDHEARVSRLTPDGQVSVVAELGGAATGSFAAIGRRLAVGRLDGTVFLLEADGRIVWSIDLEDSVVAPVAADGGVLYVPLLRGHLVKLQ